VDGEWDLAATEVMLVGPDDAFLKHEGQAEVVDGRSLHAMRGAHPSWCEANHSLRVPAIARLAYTAANARNTAPTPDVSRVKSTMAITVNSRAAIALPMTWLDIQQCTSLRCGSFPKVTSFPTTEPTLIGGTSER
jgi:hypothetical protein